MGPTNWSIRHSTTIFVLIFVVTIFGLTAYQGLPREAAPDITIPYVMVTTPYIGVSPADIELLITDPMEEELEQLKDVREIRSTSAEGASIISIEFEPTVDIDNALQLVRERVAVAKVEIPPEAEEPIVSEISFSEFPIMVVNISGDVGLVNLRTIAEEMQDDIESIPGILEVTLVGGLEREITVEADPRLLSYYRVSLLELANALGRENVNVPGGSVELGELNYSVRVPGEFERVSEIEDIAIREEDGETIRVSDVARVIDGFEDQGTYSRLNGVESVSLSVTRRAGENIPVIADQIHQLVAEANAEYDGILSFAVLADVSNDIEDRVSELENNIITGLILVAAVLFFFMGGLRNALFVAIAIPMSMLLSFIVLAALGVTLNIVVLFSLVLALGMLVDNAIVIVENIYRHGNMGKSNVQAAMDGVAEVAWPVIASTATTVFAFAPMLFWPGIMGEFMGFLPLTVIVVLSASLFVALIINPVICAALLRVKKTDREPNPDDPLDELNALPNNALYRAYRWSLRFAVNHRWLVIICMFAAFIGTFSLYGRFNAGVEFFPEVTPERFFINVSLPDGSNLDASDRVVRMVEALLANEENIQDFVADVGAGTGSNDFSASSGAPHKSRITVELLPAEDQIESAYDTIARLREGVTDIVGAEIDIVKESGGPPSGAPVAIEITGDNFETLGHIAQDVSQIMRGIDGVVNLQDDYEAGRSEITVTVDREAAAAVGVDTQDVANTVRAAVNGMIATSFRAEDDEYDVIVRLPERARDAIEDIGNLRVATRTGEDVLLSSVGEVTIERGYGSIRHVDSDRVVTITADAGEGVNAQALLAQVQAELSRSYEIPAGYDLRYTGQNKDQEEAQAFLGKALMGALFLIFLILVTQFNSLMQPGIILVSVILSLLGVLWILMLRQLPFNVIMTGVGIISLAGVVVNNAIVLIDYINQLKARGIVSKDAVIAAGLVRFRPVMLTAVTTVLSLMPLVLGFSIDFRAGGIVYGGSSVEMWGPMANAVVAGLIVATMLTLIVVPVMYATIDRQKLFIAVRILKREPDPSLGDPEDVMPKRRRKKAERKPRRKEESEGATAPSGGPVAEGA